MDGSSTSEKYGGASDRVTEWNFISFHLNTVTSMGVLGGIMIALGILLYCFSRTCWLSIWRSIHCCGCAIGTDPEQKQTMTAYSTMAIAVNTLPSTPSQGDIDTLEQSTSLKIGKQKKKQAQKELEKAKTMEG